MSTYCLKKFVCLKKVRNISVYYKSLSDSNWRENDYNWACFYSNKILCVGWEGKILFWITNMTNYYLFYVIIAIWEWIVYYFSNYLHDKLFILTSILLITYKRTNWREKTMFLCQWLEKDIYWKSTKDDY